MRDGASYWRIECLHGEHLPSYIRPGFPMIPFSILDLSPVPDGLSVRDALDQSRQLAIKAEDAGFKRIWVAEHHGMPGIASAATSVVIAHIGAATKRIRIGSGGIMLPNPSPLVIAERSEEHT